MGGLLVVRVLVVGCVVVVVVVVVESPRRKRKRKRSGLIFSVLWRTAYIPSRT